MASPTVTVTYFPEARPVTVLDFRNGAGFDIGVPYVELYLMPLCRYAALGSAHMDAQNTPLIKSVEDRYQETRAFLGLADIQSPAAST